MSTSRLAGVLQPVLDSLRRHAAPSGQLVGREVPLGRNHVEAVLALDANGDIHLLLTPAAIDGKRFARLALKSLAIGNREWVVAGRASASYLDLTCSTKKSPGFERPFLGLCEDLLTEISISSVTPEDAVHRACARWRRFWSSEPTVFTIEWLHGLVGELAFLQALIENYGTRVVTTWMGPAGRDHDFQVGNHLAVEVKTSTLVPPTIECNLNQLDSGIFSQLFLACYLLTRVDEGGLSLPGLVGLIEDALRADESSLDLFWEKLAEARYRRELDERYREVNFTLGLPSVFRVDEKFPKVTSGSFRTPPDGRIRAVRYSLQLVDVTPEPEGILSGGLSGFRTS